MSTDLRWTLEKAIGDLVNLSVHLPPEQRLAVEKIARNLRRALPWGRYQQEGFALNLRCSSLMP